jgi:hypothetical protein
MKLDADTVLAQFSRSLVGLEHSEEKYAGWGVLGHA